MPPAKRKTTIREVARRAGVSVATVSRALNNSPLVDHTTSEKVLTAAKRLRYVPNASARSLSTRRTETIGLILPDMHGEFFSEIIRGADAVARRHHYHLLVSSTHSNRQELETTLSTLHGRIDGLILMSPHLESETLLHHAPSELPIVLIGPVEDAGEIDAIHVDNEGGGFQVGMHLHELGHRRIAVVKGPKGNVDAAERYFGFMRAMKQVGITLPIELMLEGDFTGAGGYQAALNLLALVPRPTAVFALNDEMAIGLLRCFHEKGIRVPEDLAVAGFDDVQMSEVIRPALTTVHVDISELGALAAKRVLALGMKESAQQKRTTVVLPSRLIIRQSTSPATNPIHLQRA